MKVIVDANILIAGLLKNGTTRKLLLQNNLELHNPEFILTEFLNHIQELAKKAGMSNRLFKDYAELLIAESEINLIKISNIKPNIEIAERISPDPDDGQYFAAAITLKCPIWSNDKALKKQNTVTILSTKDLLNLMK
jgi:predicted nucleic acid-binding protein